MKRDFLLAIMLLFALLLQETIMTELTIFGLQADLVFALLLGFSFFLPVVKLDILAFSVGLLRGFISLPVVDSLGFYPFIYLVVTMLISRFLAPHLPQTLRHRLPILAMALVLSACLQLLIWLLILPSVNINWHSFLLGLGEGCYTVVVWIVLELLLLNHLEMRWQNK